MYCSSCGKEIGEDEKFCKYCGSSIHKNIQNNENDTIKIGMKYFNFYSKFYLSFIIIINMLSFVNFSGIEEWNIYTYAILVIDIMLYILLPMKLLNDLRKKTKFIYKLLLAFLLLDYIFKVITVSFTIYINHPESSLIEYIFLSISIFGIWFVPNLIYFIKRKKFFIN